MASSTSETTQKRKGLVLTLEKKLESSLNYERPTHKGLFLCQRNLEFQSSGKIGRRLRPMCLLVRILHLQRSAASLGSLSLKSLTRPATCGFSSNVPILQEKSLHLFSFIYLDKDEGASSGWLHKICARHGVRV